MSTDNSTNDAQPMHNGSRQHMPSVTEENTAVPKHVAARKLSSKKFKIETIAASDDPLYNPNAPPVSSPIPNRQRENAKPPLASPSSPRDSRIEPEGFDGEGEFQSIEDLRMSKNRTSSVLSTNDQKFFSVEDVSKERPASAEILDNRMPVATTSSPNSNGDEELNQDGVVVMQTVEDSNSTAIRYSRRLGKSNLKFDDSFYKKATVETRVSSHTETDIVTDIFVPVPTGLTASPSTMSLNENMHETITSAYETNLSINKLLRERHKGLAAVGRFFGSKQRELESEKSTLEPSISQKKKKNICRKIQPVHVFLVIVFVIIVSSTVVTLVMMKRNRENMFAIDGYKFSYNTRELVVYPYTSASQLAPHDDVIIFRAELGVNLGVGDPFNCSHNFTDANLVGCYKWNSETTLKLFREEFDDRGLCIRVEWEALSFSSMLEDCIDIATNFGMWYGGHSNSRFLHLGKEEVPLSSFLPGEKFGQLAERFWISSNNTGVTASYDFPLHLRVVAGSSPKLCLSSWYGYHPGDFYSRKLHYSICRADSYKELHQQIMKQFFPSFTTKTFNYSAVSKPIYTYDGGDIVNDLDAQEYSYIIFNQSSMLTANKTPSVQGVADNQTGFFISPYVEVADSAMHLETHEWIQSTDLDSPRILNRNSIFYTMLNASSLSNISLPNNSLLQVVDLNIGDLRGQEFYSINETVLTFQPYIHNFITFVTESTSQPVMSSYVSALQNSYIIVNLRPITDIQETVKNVLHSSLVGYHLINFGEIAEVFSADLFTRLLQLTIFSPVVQYSQSVLKWNSDPTVMQSWGLCRDARASLRIEETIETHLAEGKTSPLFTPVWWQNNDEEGYTITDQFIFNDRYLVAPIYNTTSNLRQVFFPCGVWVRINIFDTNAKYDNIVFSQGPETKVFEVNSVDEMLVFQYGEPNEPCT